MLEADKALLDGMPRLRTRLPRTARRPARGVQVSLSLPTIKGQSV